MATPVQRPGLGRGQATGAATALAGRREFRSNGAVYLAAKFVSQVSQNVLIIALLVTAGTSSSASIGLSGLFVAMLIPSLLLGPVGGSFVDRVGPARAFAFGALLRAAAIVPGFFLLGDSGLVWVVAALYSSASQVFTPAEFALVHHVQGRVPGRTYSAITVAQYSGQAIGILVIAPLFYFLGGQAAVLLVSIAGFLGVAASGFELVSRRVEGAAPAHGEAAARPTFRAVARFLLTDGRAFYAVVALTLSGIISRVLVVSLPSYIRDQVDLGSLGAVLLFVPGALGIAAGLAWASRRLTLETAFPTMRNASLILLSALFAFAFLDHGVSIVTQNTMPASIRSVEAALNTTAAVVVPASFAAGMGMALVLMSGRLTLTELAPAGAQGRVHAVQLAITESLLVVPVLVAGLATAVAGARVTLAVVGIIAVVTLFAMELRRVPAPVPAIEPLEPSPFPAQGEGTPA